MLPSISNTDPKPNRDLSTPLLLKRRSRNSLQLFTLPLKQLFSCYCLGFGSFLSLCTLHRLELLLFVMEEGDNILDAIYEEDNFDDVDDDVHMVDVEEGELVEPDSQNALGQSSAGDINDANQEPRSKNRRRKKRNKRKKGSGSNAGDINSFSLLSHLVQWFCLILFPCCSLLVDEEKEIMNEGNDISFFPDLKIFVDTCRQLKEKKSYMVYTAVGCLGVSALSDLIKEVDAIQACGGQKTVDGKRFRTGGGILWSILKVREPKVYKEIMKKTKEFEKQFRQPNVKQRPVPEKEDSSQEVPFSFAGRAQGNVSDGGFLAPQMQSQHEPAMSEEKPISVRDRLRIPVSYDDDLLGENTVNGAT
ncbi:hypothetical protein VNO77_10578 [Canavalia gladiata]|uniref:Phosphorylated adapter RNA export protein n=1 Tax=Canavalia gladiata TaxID=3824 RepID=A0AAN9ME99_CANGL